MKLNLILGQASHPKQKKRVSGIFSNCSSSKFSRLIKRKRANDDGDGIPFSFNMLRSALCLLFWHEGISSLPLPLTPPSLPPSLPPLSLCPLVVHSIHFTPFSLELLMSMYTGPACPG